MYINQIFKYLILLTLLCCNLVMYPQDADSLQVFKDVHYKLEMQAGFSAGKTPLWLHSNRHGLSSLEKTNGYMRGSLERSVNTDSCRKWALGYGIDMALPLHYTSNVVLQQAYVEARWKHGMLSIGSKERPMELKNNLLSSGSQTFGINARPVPQVRISLPEYWKLPLLNGWLQLKGHLSFGWMTDDAWKKDFTGQLSNYATDVLYHSKAGYFKFSNPKCSKWSVELGLEMAAQFGGKSHRLNEGQMEVIEGRRHFKDFIYAIVTGGDAEGEYQYTNLEGNHMGSWVLRLNYDTKRWALHLYADKYFEDHSGMFLLDYNGYGTGNEWDEKKEKKFLFYSPKDIMLGLELNLKKGTWIQDVVLEYLYTKYQSGALYHDHTPTMSAHIGGVDNYYNHYIYDGWFHWGEVIGNPLYRSPIYNENGELRVNNNRFTAFHLGISGKPAPYLLYRVLASYQDGLGRYENPFSHVKHNVSVLAEVDYRFSIGKSDGWGLKCGIGFDDGDLLGYHQGVQITISKRGLIK